MSEITALLVEARAVARRSRAPGPRATGAVAVTAGGQHFPGATVQLDCAPGLSACAEQVAISAARAGSDEPIACLALWVPAGAGPHPCGACRQIWQELAPDATLYLQRGEGAITSLAVTDLLPHAFVQFEPDDPGAPAAGGA